MSNDPSHHGQHKRNAQSASGPSSQYQNPPGVLPANPTSYSNPYQSSYQPTYSTGQPSFTYPSQPHLQQQTPLQQQLQFSQHTPMTPSSSRKRRASEVDDPSSSLSGSGTLAGYSMQQQQPGSMMPGQPGSSSNVGLGIAGSSHESNVKSQELGTPVAKKGRTNTPWTAGEEQRLKQMRDAGNSWSEIAKTFPLRTEGSVKKHWYKDMHYAEFAEDEGSFSSALLTAIKEYEANKWKFIGQKVGKPAKACELFAKEHFGKT